MLKIILVVINSLLIYNIVQSQIILTDTFSQDFEISITPSEFDLWVSNQFSFFKKGNEVSKNDLKSRTFNRIAIGKFISNNTILKAIDIVSAIELNSNKTKVNYQETIGFVDSLVHLSVDRPDLKRELLEKKAFLIENSSSISIEAQDNLIATLSELSGLTDTENLELGLLFMESNVKLGNLLFYKKSDKEGAKKYVRKALRYPFYLISDEYYSKEMREMYIEAGLLMIQINRGDLYELNHLYFVISTTPALYPLLKKYIEEVGGTWDRDNPDTILKFRHD